MRKDLICPCSVCREKPKQSEPRYLIRTPAKKRMSPAEAFFWTLLFFAFLFIIGHYFWT